MSKLLKNTPVGSIPAEEARAKLSAEIAASKLGGSNYTFKCVVCGARHRVTTYRAIRSCINKASRYPSRYRDAMPYVQHISYWGRLDDIKAVEVLYMTPVVSFILPSISMSAIYSKPKQIADFLVDYFNAVPPREENLHFKGSGILVNYSNDEILKEAPQIILSEAFNEFITFEIEQLVGAAIEPIATSLLNAAYVISKHIDIFSDLLGDDVIDYSDYREQVEAIAYEAANIQRTNEIEVISLIEELLSAHYQPYNNVMANPAPYTKVSGLLNSKFLSTGKIAVFNSNGCTVASSSRSWGNDNIKIIVSAPGEYPGPRMYHLLKYMLERLLPAEQRAQELIASARKNFSSKARRKRRTKKIAGQISLL